MNAEQVQQIVAEAIAAERARRAEPLGGNQVNAVGVKLPEFWTSDPVMWFSQAEAVFRRSNITVSFTKYDHVLMKLPEAVVVSVRNLVSSIQPTDTDAYERLKERLTASYAKSKWQQVFSLIKHPDLCDRRPSQMMNEMLTLLPDGDTGDSTIFLGLFLLRLPVSMRDHLAAGDYTPAEEMARHADVLWDARAGDSAVAAVSAEVDAVSVRSPRTDNRRRSPARDNRRRSPDRRSRPPRKQTPGRDGGRDSNRSSSLCFYHGKYGQKAHRCEAPCTWSEN